MALTIVIGNKTYSSWSLRGWLAVRHTGLAFREIMLPLDTPEFYERIRDYSPSGFVPALIHNGTTKVWDSLAIIDYCARLAPQKFWWPDNDAAFGFARSMTAEMHSGFMALRRAAPFNTKAKYRGLALSPAVAADVKRIDALWSEAIERFGDGGPYLFGGFSAADMMYAPIVGRFLAYGVSLSPAATAYAMAVRSNAGVSEWYDAAKDETLVVAADEIDPATTMLGDPA
ncbi:glutathione S-transferase family protein [Pseudokordiimonas caeni]|uniref:glutathione S-transferase family protein n=1 Tax=Pseudokordiimonas caeni TaxID=2997908 RepID=UPI00281229E0|nr:glutathione S-transferase family protein [Pseudokordiimonas caeni]